MAKNPLPGRAETEVKIQAVLSRLFNIYIPADVTWKTQCPEGYDHSDGGVAPALTVYPESNSAWCWSHKRKYTPLKLWKIVHPTRSNIAAATGLLEEFGLRTTPLTLTERWHKLQEEGNTPPVVGVDGLKEALIIYASTLPKYATRQYDNDTLYKLNDLLSFTNDLPESVSSDTLDDLLPKLKEKLDNYWKDRYDD